MRSCAIFSRLRASAFLPERDPMSADEDFPSLLKRLAEGHSLSAESSLRAFGAIMSGEVSDARMASFIGELLSITEVEARELQKRYYRTYGTTLRGLMLEHSMPADKFLDFVHAIDVNVIPPDPKLDAFFLEADATPNPGGVPVGGQTRLDIPNDHLQYAITWFLLAAALAGVYLAYHWENGRLTIGGRTKVKT